MTNPLGELLRQRRDALGWGREALASRARSIAPHVKGLHRTAVERWEGGLGSPDPEQFAALADALNIPPKERRSVWASVLAVAERAVRGGEAA